MSCLSWKLAHLLKAASEDVLILSEPASAGFLAEEAALLNERHVVTGWKVHSLTVS